MAQSMLAVRKGLAVAVGVFLAQFAGLTVASAGETLHLKWNSIRLSENSIQGLLDSEREVRNPYWANRAEERSALYRVIQFPRRITDEDRMALERQGVEVLRYLPEDAWVVRVPAARDRGFRTLGTKIRSSSRILPEWKVSEELFAELNSGKRKSLPLLVTAYDSLAADEVEAELKRISGIQFFSRRKNAFLVKTSPDRVQRLAAIEAAEWVQEVPQFVTFDYQAWDDSASSEPEIVAPPAITGYESGTRLMNFDRAWEKGFRGEGQHVAVADTGLDSGVEATLHADFKGVFAQGYLTGLGADSWGDPQGHGTHVMGSVVGTGSLSDWNFRGGAHRARLHAMGLWSAIFDNIVPPTDFEDLILPAYENGARVHSNSWGSPRDLGAYDSFAAGADDFMWKNPDLLLVFAAGNSGEDRDRDGRIDEGSISSPGTAKNVLTVGASENLLAQGGIQKKLSELRDGTRKWGVAPIADDTLSNNSNGLAAFSSRGPTKDGRIKPDLVAPGTNIVSTLSQHPKAGKLWGAYDAHYAYAGGTSMATPLTAGAAVVAREFLVESKRISSPSAALVKATLMHTAHDLFPGQYGTGPKQELPVRRPNAHEGMGRVDMDAVVSLRESDLLVDAKAGVGVGEVYGEEVQVDGGQVIRATLVYTDAPGAASASIALVNNLDLRVRGPSGRIQSIGDRVNNWEHIEFTAKESGSYQVSVVGENVPQGRSGKQPFALVVSVR